jgi:hypothetical protein
VKLRYTSLQHDAGAAEEDHPDLPATLPGVPVVACSLHSQVAVVAAVARSQRPGARIAYVMTDAPPCPWPCPTSCTRCGSGASSTLTVTAGHAFGGDLEAVAVPSALAWPTMWPEPTWWWWGWDPGWWAPASALGTTAVEVAGIVDVAASMGARVALCCRASSADPRERHRGVSHHVRTILDLAATRPVLPLPAGLAAELDGATVVEGPDAAEVLAALDLAVTTMGRGPARIPPSSRPPRRRG